MEQFLKIENIVKDELFKELKEDIICEICQGLMVIPMQCTKCQNTFCQKCIEVWQKKGGNCPYNCNDAQFIKVIEKKRMIRKIKFKCIKGCGAEVPFDDIEKHFNSDCFQKKKTMKLMDKEEVSKYKEKNRIKKIGYFTCKNINKYYIYIVYSNNFRR